MQRASNRKDLSLKSLELFEICAAKGSLQATASETGLSISTVSHHLRNLEDHLGVSLFDHTRRPLVLTPKGQVFLRSINGALHTIRKAKAEASSGTLAEASYLRMGSIEDLDSDITPQLAVYLSHRMPQCDFLYHTGSSHDLIAMLRDRQLDVAVTANPTEAMRDLNDRPLLRDPFVVIIPAGEAAPLDQIIAGETDLPFLQFSSDLIVAKQIGAQLRRLGVPVPNRFECANTQTLLGMVAAGAGWTISTPVMFSRGQRFHQKLRMCPFPAKTFARSLALVAYPDCASGLLGLIEAKLRNLLETQVIAPLHAENPWLRDQLTLLS